MIRKVLQIEFIIQDDVLANDIEQSFVSKINQVLTTDYPDLHYTIAKHLPEKTDVTDRLLTIEDNLNLIQQGVFQRLVLKTAKKFFVINKDDIIRLEADNTYTSIFLNKKDPLIISRSIKYFENLLCKKQFVRTHRSHIVNIDKVAEYIKTDGGFIVMSNNDTVPLSSNKKAYFLQLLCG